jgi:hypothetical protein
MTFARVDANFGGVEAVKAAASRRTPKWILGNIEILEFQFLWRGART